ncbi:phage tail tape measure protein, TP901 family, core region [Pilibacter termitis]|uniref:Phage tail tape measure protein, TP901 family, core region n=1 Tax=Pilibacter termitis TaxID=263852 RepID=A0A1T4PF86_9ENTE|nr:phage tail tape measure protein [Pilibacter termitis]SJZ89886.1 phage tail tape measure protein, TP901 family, core region [Pilibacter termitis]
MAETVGNMQIKLGLDTTGFGDKINNAKNQVKYFTQELRTTDSAMKFAGNGMAGYSAKIKSLGQVMTAQKKVVNELSEKIKKQVDEQGNLTKEGERAAVSIERETAKFAGFQAQLARTTSEAKKFAIENTGVSGGLHQISEKAFSAGEKLRNIGDKMKPVSTILSAGFGVATKKAMDFSGEMVTMQSLLSDTVSNTKELDEVTTKLGDNSKKWSAQYGISTSEINNAMSELIKKGFNANETIDAMPALLNAARASGDDFTTVMDSASSTIQQFGLQAKDAGRVTDTLTYVANKTSSGFTDMGEAMKYVGPVAKATKNSLEDTASAIGILSDAGILGTQAGTSLRTALMKLSQISTDKAVAAFGELVDVAKEASGPLADSYRQSIPAIQKAQDELGNALASGNKTAIKKAQGALEDSFIDIKKAFEQMSFPDQIESLKAMREEWLRSGNSVQDFNGIIKQLVGQEALTAMTVLIDKGGGAIKEMSKETLKATGYTKKLADVMNDSAANKMNRLKEKFNVIAISLGEKLLPLLTKGMEVVSNLADKFNGLSEGTQDTILKLGGLLAVAYPASNALGNLSTVIGFLFKGFSKGAGLFNTSARAIEGVGSASQVASGGVGALAKSVGVLPSTLGLLTNPITLTVAAIGTLAVAGKLLYDDWEKHGGQWGSRMSEHQAKVVNSTSELVVNTKGSLDTFELNMKNSAKNAGEGFKQLSNDIEQSGKKMKEDLEKAYDSLPEYLKETAKIRLEEQKKEIDREVEQAKEGAKRQGDILKNALSNERAITEEEKAEIFTINEKNVQRLLELNGFKNKEAKRLAQQLNADLSDMNSKQLIEYEKSLKNVLKAQNDEYNKQEKALKTNVENKIITQKQYESELDLLKEKHTQATKTITDNLYKSAKAHGVEDTHMRQYLATLGVSVDEINRVMSASSAETEKKSEVMAKVISKMKLDWNNFKMDSKTGKLTVEGENSLIEAMSRTGEWNNLTLEEKKALVDGEQGKVELYESIMRIGKWNAYPVVAKEVGVDNTVALNKIFESESTLSRWLNAPIQNKELLASNPSVISAVLSSEQNMTRWNALPVPEKKILAQNYDLMNKVLSSENELRAFNNLTPQQKQLLAQNGDLISKIASGRGVINDFNQNANVVPKTITARDNATGTIGTILNGLNSILPYYNTTITTTHREEFIGPRQKGYKQGTDYHSGGLALVNDQSGRLFRELITLPSGKMFIPQERNTLLDLPKGTKVLRASETNKIIPQYADGVGIPSTSKFIKGLRWANNVNKLAESSNVTTIENNFSEKKLDRMIELLSRLIEKDTSVLINGKEVMREVAKEQLKEERMNNAFKGVLV